MKIEIFIITLALIILPSISFALTGPPTAELDKGQLSLSGYYTYTSQDLENIEGKNSDDRDIKLGLDNFNIHRYYGQVSLGLTDTWELYGLLGIADIKFDTIELEDHLTFGFNFDNDAFYGLGTKFTFAKNEKISFGTAVQANFFSSKWSKISVNENEEYYYDIDVWDLTAAVGPSIDMGSWKLYGGAIYNHVSLDGDYKAIGNRWIWTEDGNSDTDSFGGYIGIQPYIYKKCNMKIEGTFTNNGWGIGAGIEIPF